MSYSVSGLRQTILWGQIETSRLLDVCLGALFIVCFEYGLSNELTKKESQSFDGILRGKRDLSFFSFLSKQHLLKRECLLFKFLDFFSLLLKITEVNNQTQLRECPMAKEHLKINSSDLGNKEIRYFKEVLANLL